MDKTRRLQSFARIPGDYMLKIIRDPSRLPIH
jgi:hypothetical protein